MADPTLEYFDQRQALVKLETVPGTDPVLDPATDGILLRDGSSGTEIATAARNVDRPYFGGQRFTVTQETAFIQGLFDLFPAAQPGVAGAPGEMYAHRLILPAGFAITRDALNKITRYNPISRNVPAAWQRWYHNGTYRNIQSGRHTLSSVSAAIDATFQAQVRMQGVCDAVPEGAMPEIPTDDINPVTISWDNAECLLSVVGGSVTGLHLWARELTWNLGADVGTTRFTEKQVTGQRNRNNIEGTCFFVRPKDSDVNIHALRKQHALVQFDFTVWESSAKNGLWTRHGVQMQIRDIGEDQIDGYAAYRVTGPLIPTNNGVGGDEVYIACGDDSP